VLGILESEKEMVDIKVTYIDHMGSDLSVVNSARVSFGKKSECEKKRWVDMGVWCGDMPVLNERDTKLVHYLAKHDHFSPFNHTFVTLHVEAPIFVARQLQKHEYMIWNEISRRYVDSEPEFYVPDFWRGRSADKKQGSDGVLTGSAINSANSMMGCAESEARAAYNALLEEGVAPEQARMVLPQSMMTEWIWSGTVKAFHKMVSLRIKLDTQYESQLVAHQVSALLYDLYPVSWGALRAYEG
jgi:thymidylate synthase (FAD)